jgi:hypothetical protein
MFNMTWAPFVALAETASDRVFLSLEKLTPQMVTERRNRHCANVVAGHTLVCISRSSVMAGHDGAA